MLTRHWLAELNIKGPYLQEDYKLQWQFAPRPSHPSFYLKTVAKNQGPNFFPQLKDKSLGGKTWPSFNILASTYLISFQLVKINHHALHELVRWREALSTPLLCLLTLPLLHIMHVVDECSSSQLVEKEKPG